MIGPGNSEDEFEKSWREAFEGASESPPSSVWKELDRQLAYEELATYKSKNVYYKWAVAASILLAAFLGISQYIYFTSQDNSRTLTGVVTIDNPEVQSHEVNIPNTAEEDELSFLSRKLQSPSPLPLADNKEELQFDMVDYEALEVDRIDPSLAVAANVDKEMYMLPTYNYGLVRGKKTSGDRDKYWAGLNVGSGSFDPNYESGTNTLSTSNAASTYSLISDEAVDSRGPNLREGMTSGETVALGLNFGVKLNKKWSLESGLQYARADATTTTNLVIESSKVREVIPASAEIRSIPQVENIIDSEEVLEYNYKDVDLSNQFQFATVPVKAGYMLIDNKFRLQLNAGVAANLYLGNKLSDPDNEIADVTIGPGESSPYRELSFSGLAGVQLGYEVLNRFDLVLEPNYRQAINSLTKENSSFTANPSGFGIITGIRYKFN